MSAEYIEIHPENPQQRLLRRVVSRLHEGAVIAYPTDSSYALGCHIGDKQAEAYIRRIRQVDSDHNFTLLCRDLSEISSFAVIDNTDFRLLKSLTPGAYTFILPATREVPKRLQHERRRTIGIRVPDHRIAQDLLAELGEPLMTCTLIMPGDTLPLSDPEDVYQALANEVDVIVDGGNCGLEPTTVLDMSGEQIVIARHGKGDVSFLEDKG